MSRPSEHPCVLLATTNPAKRRELLQLLGDMPVRWLTLIDLAPAPDVQETGATFRENAILKAEAYADWSGLPALADDGGLEIDALGGEPGVRSRRWIDGREGSDEELIAYTLARLRGRLPSERGAAMRVVEALAFPPPGTALHPAAARLGARAWAGPVPPEPIVGEGQVRGIIPTHATDRRDPGFPFRSVFWIPELGKFYVDITVQEHERLNHRRLSLRPIRAWLTTHLGRMQTSGDAYTSK